MIACSAAVLAFDRPPHQLISRKDITPTPSQPINNWYMLFAVMIMTIATRKIVRYLINLLMFGSVFMYQVENSVMDHVMNRVIGMNVSESVSSVIDILMFSVVVIISGGGESVSLWLLFIRRLIGIRLMKNISNRLFLGSCGLGFIMVEKVNDRKIVKVIVGIIRSMFYHLDLHQEV